MKSNSIGSMIVGGGGGRPAKTLYEKTRDATIRINNNKKEIVSNEKNIVLLKRQLSKTKKYKNELQSLKNLFGHKKEDDIKELTGPSRKLVNTQNKTRKQLHGVLQKRVDNKVKKETQQLSLQIEKLNHKNSLAKERIKTAKKIIANPLHNKTKKLGGNKKR